MMMKTCCQEKKKSKKKNEEEEEEGKKKARRLLLLENSNISVMSIDEFYDGGKAFNRSGQSIWPLIIHSSIAGDADACRCCLCQF